jgi:hypothetical protein
MKPLHPLCDELKWAYHAEFLGKLKNITPLCLLDDEHPGAEHTSCFSSIESCKKQYKNYNTITVHFEFLDILQAFFGLHRHMFNTSQHKNGSDEISLTKNFFT